MNATDNIATDLFYKIRSRFRGLKLGAEDGTVTIKPNEARFFDFDYMEGETPIGHVSISLAEPNSMKVYFSTGITEAMDQQQKANWYSFLKELRQFAKRRLIAFDTRDIAKDNLDQRDYAFLSQHAQQQKTPVGESVMKESAMYGTKTMSFQKLMDTRMIIKHSQALVDDTQPGARTRHISALFIENQDGERFKYPFIHLAGARAMQRHVANGGLPYDDVGKSIISMSEQIAQLKSFNNYVVRNDLMNSDTNNIVERSSSALNNLREQIKALAKQSHYESYKANFQIQETPEVPEEVVEDYTEKFTIRNFKEDIKSVFPVLYRLMKEQDSSIDYDDIVEMTSEDEDVQESNNEAYDPFSQFEEWAMTLGERSAIQDPKQQEAAIGELNELMGQHFPAGVDGTNAIESLKGIIDDPILHKQIEQASKEDPEVCVRPMVKQWLEANAPEVVSQVDFGDMQEEGIDEADSESIKYNEYGEWQQAARQAGANNFSSFNSDGKLILNDPEGEWEGGDESYEQAEIIKKGAPAQTIGRWDWDNMSGEILQTEMSESEEGAKKSDVPAALRKAKGDKDWRVSTQDLEKEKERNISSKEWLKKQNESVDVGELAEFISSFYDKDSGTFPKGPEGVATMVGKKFGERAEQAARRMVERMAPKQAAPELQELNRIRELSGMQAEQVHQFKKGDLVRFKGQDEEFEIYGLAGQGDNPDTVYIRKPGATATQGAVASSLEPVKSNQPAAASQFKKGDSVEYKGKPYVVYAVDRDDPNTLYLQEPGQTRTMGVWAGDGSVKPVSVQTNEQSGSFEAVLADMPKDVEHFKRTGELTDDLYQVAYDYMFQKGYHGGRGDPYEQVANFVSDYIDVDESMNEPVPELEDIKRLSGISQGLGM